MLPDWLPKLMQSGIRSACGMPSCLPVNMFLSVTGIISQCFASIKISVDAPFSSGFIMRLVACYHAETDCLVWRHSFILLNEFSNAAPSSAERKPGISVDHAGIILASSSAAGYTRMAGSCKFAQRRVRACGWGGGSRGHLDREGLRLRGGAAVLR